jgi:hypothetical protein
MVDCAAGWKSATQQVGNLRYREAALTTQKAFDFRLEEAKIAVARSFIRQPPDSG